MNKKVFCILFFSIILMSSGFLLSKAFAQEDLLGYVDNIKNLLEEARQKYAIGDIDTAKRLAMKAYIDNYEYLEYPVGEQNKELNDELEIMLREELQALMRNNAPVSDVSAKIDIILEKMETVAVIVPEFGSVAGLVLVATTSIVIVLGLRFRSKGSLTHY